MLSQQLRAKTNKFIQEQDDLILQTRARLLSAKRGIENLIRLEAEGWDLSEIAELEGDYVRLFPQGLVSAEVLLDQPWEEFKEEIEKSLREIKTALIQRHTKILFSEVRIDRVITKLNLMINV